jgi:hypothetical protein
MAIGSAAILPLLARDRHATNFAPLVCCNGGVAWHATITPNACGMVCGQRHHVICLVAFGPTPPFRLFDGVRVHVTIACFSVRRFGFLLVTFRFPSAENEKVVLKLNKKFDLNLFKYTMTGGRIA